MSDTVKREVVIATINAMYDCCDAGGITDYRDLMLESVKVLPSADRPQGEWIESFKKVEVRQGAYMGTKFIHDGWSCSECSEVVEKRYPNCPYCLARMKGADDD